MQKQLSDEVRWQQFQAQSGKLLDLRAYDALLLAFLDLLPRLSTPAYLRKAWLSLLPLIEQGHILPLEQLLFQVVDSHSDTAHLWLLLGLCAQRRGDPRRARQFQAQALRLEPQLFLAHQTYLWSFLVDASLNYAQQLTPFLEYGRLLEGLSQPLPSLQRAEDPERKLRIGYVSGDFYDHSVTHMFSALFEYKNADMFTVIAYASIPRTGALNDWFRQRVQHWRDISGLSAQQAAEQIRTDQIDILLDLNGQTYGHRFDLFALKPAPLQITGLGFGWSSGLSRMDYLFTDAQIVPPERAALNPEKPLCLSSYFHWQPEADILDLPCQRTEQPVYPCFGALHQAFKLNLETLQLWAEILKAVPSAKLLFKDKGFDNPQMQKYYRLWFKHWGISPQRLLFAGRSSQREHVSLYQHVDVCLDPFPYQAGISACEALWMGVPVVGLSGGTRSANSLLHSVGHPELLAHSHAAYLHIATELVQDKRRLQAYRQQLRQDLLNSAICEPARFCAETEAFYRQIWRQHVTTQR